MNYCQNIINEIRMKKETFEFNKFNENENHNIIEENKEILDLSHMIIENMKNKDSTIIKDKNIFNATYETDREPHVRDMMEEYFKKENQDIFENKVIEIEQIEEKEIQKLFSRFKKLPKKYATYETYKKVKEYFKYAEVILVFILLFFIHIYLNQIQISELSLFNNRAIDIFDDQDYCINQYKKITSADKLNDWMVNCYLQV
jgi:hypothetical protein